jgi:hypothetical protein
MRIEWIAAAVLSAAVGVAVAKLPPPTPEQEQAAAAKKDAEAAQLEKEKQLLERAQDRIAEYYRRTKGGSAGVGATRGGQVEATNMPKTAKELPGSAGAGGGTKQSAEAHSAPAK